MSCSVTIGGVSYREVSPPFRTLAHTHTHMKTTAHSTRMHVCTQTHTNTGMNANTHTHTQEDIEIISLFKHTAETMNIPSRT